MSVTDLPLYLGIALGLLVAMQLAGTLVSFSRRMYREEVEFQIRRQKLLLELAAVQGRDSSPSDAAWEGWRTFCVSRLVRETAETVSLYLAPEDGRPLPSFVPGQYVTLRLRVPGQSKPVVRCYSLSAVGSGDHYRCTVKEIPPPIDRPELPFGRVSRHLNRRLAVGDLLELKAPQGKFVLDEADGPVVLLGAGIGVTPLFAMLQSIARSKSPRQVFAFLQFRNGEQHPLRVELQAMSERHPNLQIITLYSQPSVGDVIGRDYLVQGRLTIDLVRRRLPGGKFVFYVCGPGGFMQSMLAGLEQWGVATSQVHFEAFGPASVKALSARSQESDELLAAGPQVRFESSGITAQWAPRCQSLLELAEAHEAPLDSGCRAGSCGTCAVPIKSGKVTYTAAPSHLPPPGTCLPCICVPDGPVVLQA